LPSNTQSAYAGNVQPIFTASCATSLSCHQAGGAGPVDLSEGVSYSHIVNVVSDQDPTKNFVTPFQPDVSYLMNKIDGVGVSTRMRLGGPSLDQPTADMVRTWILEGAANN